MSVLAKHLNQKQYRKHSIYSLFKNKKIYVYFILYSFSEVDLNFFFKNKTTYIEKKKIKSICTNKIFQFILVNLKIKMME